MQCVVSRRKPSVRASVVCTRGAGCAHHAAGAIHQGWRPTSRCQADPGRRQSMV